MSITYSSGYYTFSSDSSDQLITQEEEEFASSGQKLFLEIVANPDASFNGNVVIGVEMQLADGTTENETTTVSHTTLTDSTNNTISGSIILNPSTSSVVSVKPLFGIDSNATAGSVDLKAPFYVGAVEKGADVTRVLRPNEIFTSDGTFDVPDDIYTVWVTMIGGGGGGAASRRGDLTRQPGGGGAGQFVYRARVSVTPGASISVTVGQGGAGASTTGGVADGSNGTASSFGSLLSCPGGTAGICPDSNVASAKHGGHGATTGGVESGTDFNNDGESLPHPASFRAGSDADNTQNILIFTGVGGTGATSGTQRCGGGGGGFNGNGGDAIIDTTSPAEASDPDANSGAGGAAAHLQNSSGTATASDGADGIVIVEW